jgi:hypothetical protein
MGSSVTAVCKCGYEETFMVGGGEANFKTFCAFPALYQKCNRIVSANLLSKRPKYPECRSTKIVAYDQDELRKRKGRHTVAEWCMEEELGTTLELTDGRYFCPSCDSFDLTFGDGGMDWD